jgi:hypothetical protein
LKLLPPEAIPVAIRAAAIGTEVYYNSQNQENPVPNIIDWKSDQLSIGKAIMYTNSVQGMKMIPRIGQMRVLNVAAHTAGRKSHHRMAARRGPKRTRAVRAQHIVSLLYLDIQLTGLEGLHPNPIPVPKRATTVGGDVCHHSQGDPEPIKAKQATWSNDHIH